MNVVRRTLAAAAISGTALAGVATVGATAAQATTKLPTSLHIKAPHVVTYDSTATVTGKLRLAGHKRTAVGGETVTLMARTTKPKSHWTADGTGTTATDGTVSITTANPLTQTEEVRLVYAGDTTTSPATKGSKSAIKTIKVSYSVTASVSGSTPSASIAATVAPAKKGATVLLQVQGSKGWSTVGHAKEDASGNVTFTVKKAGNYRVVKEAGHGLLTGKSATLAVS